MSVAVVLPGGGARGAYEVGALSVLLPALEKRGERVSIWCGTSVGAINAAVLASLAHLPVEEQVEGALAIWKGLRKQDVIARMVGPGGARMALRLVGHALGVPGVGLASVLDPSPLVGSLDRWVDWQRLARNVRANEVEAVCVVATRLATGTPVGFVASRSAIPNRSSNEIRYVKTRLRERARPRVRGDPGAVPDGRGDRSARRRRPLYGWGDAAQQPAQARCRPRCREGDRDRLRAVQARRRDAGVRAPAAEHRRRGRKRARRPARGPGGKRPASRRRDQLVLRRGPQHRADRVAQDLSDRPRAGALPADLLRPRRPAASGRDRAAGRDARSASATEGFAPCATWTSRSWLACSERESLARRVPLLPALRPAVCRRPDRDGQTRRAPLVAPAPSLLVSRRRARSVERAGRSSADQRGACDRGVQGAAHAAPAT